MPARSKPLRLLGSGGSPGSDIMMLQRGKKEEDNIDNSNGDF